MSPTKPHGATRREVATLALGVLMVVVAIIAIVILSVSGSSVG